MAHLEKLRRDNGWMKAIIEKQWEFWWWMQEFDFKEYVYELLPEMHDSLTFVIVVR